jgi:hypothetical protein
LAVREGATATCGGASTVFFASISLGGIDGPIAGGVLEAPAHVRGRRVGAVALVGAADRLVAPALHLRTKVQRVALQAT